MKAHRLSKEYFSRPIFVALPQIIKSVAERLFSLSDKKGRIPVNRKDPWGTLAQLAHCDVETLHELAEHNYFINLKHSAQITSTRPSSSSIYYVYIKVAKKIADKREKNLSRVKKCREKSYLLSANQGQNVTHKVTHKVTHNVMPNVMRNVMLSVTPEESQKEQIHTEKSTAYVENSDTSFSTNSLVRDRTRVFSSSSFNVFIKEKENTSTYYNTCNTGDKKNEGKIFMIKAPLMEKKSQLDQNLELNKGRHHNEHVVKKSGNSSLASFLLKFKKLYHQARAAYPSIKYKDEQILGELLTEHGPEKLDTAIDGFFSKHNPSHEWYMGKPSQKGAVGNFTIPLLKAGLQAAVIAGEKIRSEERQAQRKEQEKQQFRAKYLVQPSHEERERSRIACQKALSEFLHTIKNTGEEPKESHLTHKNAQRIDF